MKKTLLLLLLGVSVLLVSCNNSSQQNAADTSTIPKTTPTATIETTTVLEEITVLNINYDCFDDTDVPQCESFFNVEYAFSSCDLWEDSGFATYLFITDKNKDEIEEILPTYNGYINIDNCLSLYDNYLSDIGFSVKEGISEDGLSEYIYSKDNIKVTLEYDDSNMYFTIVDTARYSE